MRHIDTNAAAALFIALACALLTSACGPASSTEYGGLWQGDDESELKYMDAGEQIEETYTMENRTLELIELGDDLVAVDLFPIFDYSCSAIGEVNDSGDLIFEEQECIAENDGVTETYEFEGEANLISEDRVEFELVGSIIIKNSNGGEVKIDYTHTFEGERL